MWSDGQSGKERAEYQWVSVSAITREKEVL